MRVADNFNARIRAQQTAVAKAKLELQLAIEKLTSEEIRLALLCDQKERAEARAAEATR